MMLCIPFFLLLQLLVWSTTTTRMVVQANPSMGHDFTALIVLVQFPDHADRLLPDRSYFQTLCDTRIMDYLEQQSYGQYALKQCHVMEWSMTNNTEAYFAAGVANRKSPEESAGFAVPVLDRLDTIITDWSIYDVNGDGALDAVICTFHFFVDWMDGWTDGWMTHCTERQCVWTGICLLYLLTPSLPRNLVYI
jgi:hypothetical protein